MVRNLPDEILYLICDQLAQGRFGFNTLYQCAISSPSLVVPALKSLYGSSHVWASLNSFRSGEAELEKTKTCKWGLMWHSIIASTSDRTYLPYYRFLRVLDVGELEDYLIKIDFRGDKDIFFSEGVDVMDSWHKYSEQRKMIIFSCPLDVREIVEAIGDAITSKDHLLKALKGDMYPESLSRWIARSPQLQCLALRQSSSLPSDAAISIGKHCPNFQEFIISHWSSCRPMPPNTHLKNFMRDLPPNTLKYLFIGYPNYESFPIGSLSSHAESLVEIRLSSVRWDSITSFATLKSCPNLKVLKIEDSRYPSLKKAPDIAVELARWVCSCKNLTELDLVNFHNVLDVSTTVVLDGSIKLTKLTVAGYSMKDARAFHQGLRNQPWLDELELKAQSTDLPSDQAILIQSLCRLSNLQLVVLEGVSDNFTPEDLSSLATHLLDLRLLVTGGTSFDDSSLESLSTFPKLHNVSIMGRSWFTVNGLLDFASRVQGRSFVLEIMKQDEELDISEEDQDRIFDALQHNGRGCFSLSLFQDYISSDEELPYSDSNSDDDDDDDDDDDGDSLDFPSDDSLHGYWDEDSEDDYLMGFNPWDLLDDGGPFPGVGDSHPIPGTDSEFDENDPWLNPEPHSEPHSESESESDDESGVSEPEQVIWSLNPT